MRNILLLEPNYKNKYPPIGLMKIATYYRKQGDNVVFYKGDLKDFVIREIVNECIVKLNKIDKNIEWNTLFCEIFQYIKTRKKEYFNKILSVNSNYASLVTTWLDYYKQYYHKGKYKEEPRWDKVFVTTLFTFYWDITIETIEFAKIMVKKQDDLMVGGVLATIQAKEIEIATGIKPHKGVLGTPGELDNNNPDIIDELPLDYSILDEIDYKYPEVNAYYGYSTRGCIRKCPFCAVPILEPHFCNYLPLQNKIKEISDLYGEQRNLLLMDNNVLASDKFADIINDIKASGFTKDAKYYEPNMLDITIRNLQNNINDRAYIRKAYYLISDLESRISLFDTQKYIYGIREKYHLLKLETVKKENILFAAEKLTDIFEKYRSKVPKQRFVDFNQGVDARKFTLENIKLLSEIPIKPLRIAFDDIKSLPDYERAIRWSIDAGIKDFSNYLLYNFNDKPLELYQRLKFNVDLCEEYKNKSINIYSFPMKFHPINGEYSHNRDFIGKYWNRKYIRSIQAILNSTKGKIGKGLSFFEKAFGKDEDDFFMLLEMPETFILYRFFFEWLETQNWEASTKKWADDFYSLNSTDMEEAISIIHQYNFVNVESKTTNPAVLKVLKYYTNYRNDIITPGTDLYRLKQIYDNDPIVIATRHKKKNSDI